MSRNPERVGFSEYARQVAREQSTIRRHATGYAAFISAVDGRTLEEAIERAKAGVETETVIDAIAEAEGVTFQTARHRTEEVREVRAVAQERAERKGTTVEEEAPVVAEQRVKARAAQKRVRKEYAGGTPSATSKSRATWPSPTAVSPMR